jgi:fibronectin-binding autotransporter adhesin
MSVPTPRQPFAWPRLPGWGNILAIACLAAFGTREARAVDGTWVGVTTDWADPANWTSQPDVPNGTATFSNTGSATVDSSSFVVIGAIQFTAAPNALSFTINNNIDFFFLSGAGVFNNSTSSQTFNVFGDGFGFINSATASGGTGLVTYNNSSFLNFNDSTTAGTATIANSNIGNVTWSSTSSAGSAIITNNGMATFSDNATAGNANIGNASAGTLTFSNASSAGSATILNSGVMQFSNTSTAAGSIITNNGGLDFINSSSAGAATITNGGAMSFADNAAAGTATITNAAAGTLTFSGAATAQGATITNSGAIQFNDTSSAGTAGITNNNAMAFNAGSTAAAASITNTLNATTSFNDHSLAGTATIINNPGGSAVFGQVAGSASSADHASILNAAGSSGVGSGGITRFQESTTAGSATITTQNNAAVGFFATASGGAARFITEAGGVFDISQLASAGTTAGSIEGAGTYYLGAKQLTVGSTSLSTTVSGIISDGGCSCFGVGGTGGSMIKVGTGTLTLSNTNTYTGTTTILAGTLQIGNGGATGAAGTGTIIDNSVLAFNRSNLLTVANTITGTGAVNQIGAGTTVLTGASTYTGPTTISAGQLTVALGASIVSNVINNAVLDNSGGIGGTVANSGSFTNSGSVAERVTNNAGTTTNAGALNSGLTNLAGSTINSGTIVQGITVSGGNFTQSAGSVSGGATNTAVVNANGGAVNGTIANNAGTFNVGGTVTSDGSFINASGAALTIGATGNYALAGPLDNAGNVANGGLFSANVAGNSGTIFNSGSWIGTINTSGSFSNNSGASVAGRVTSGGTLVNQGALNGGLVVAGGVSTNAGAIAQGVTVSGGSFTQNSGSVSGGLANSASVNAIGGALNGAIATNAGALTVTSGGLLDASAGGLSNLAGGTITVAQGGTLRDDLANAGTVTNNGLYVANVASNSGSITNTGTWTGNVASSTGTISNAGIWTGTVTTSGSFTNAAGGSLSSLLSVTGGTALNNGALNGGVQVNGGTLTGSGSVSGATVTGGTFAPGSGVAGSSMTIASNLSLTSGVQYVVALNPSTSSFANVAGTATLGGATVNAVYANGNYISKRYTILNAAGVSGAFSGPVNTNLPANFNAAITYDATHAYLDLTLNFVPPLPGPTAPVYTPLNVNQGNVATTLVNYFNRTGGIPMAFGALSPAGLTQASGETATGAQQTTFNAMNQFLGLLTDPFVAGRDVSLARGAAFADEDAANAYTAKHRRSGTEREAYGMITKAVPRAPSFEQRWNVWAAGFGGSQTTDGDAALGTNAATSRIYGGAVGADYWFSPQTVAGFALAGGGTEFGVANGGTGRSDLFQAGALIRHTAGTAYLTGALAYGWQDITTDRIVTAAGIDRLRAQFNANAYSGRIEGGYRFANPWLAITPYAAGQITAFELPSYAETVVGANTFALAYGGQTVTATRSELGLRSDKSWTLGDGVFTLRGRAAWAHDFNTDRNAQASFQTLPGASFVVNGAPSARDAALTTASAELRLASGLALAATFEGEFSDITRSYAGKGVVRYAW